MEAKRRDCRSAIFSVLLLSLQVSALGDKDDIPGRQGISLNNTGRWVEQISWEPRAYIHHGFLTDQECDDLVELARPMMRRSTVVGQGGKSVLDNIRTSFGTFLRRKQNALMTAVEERLEQWTLLPLAHQEDMQILRYAPGQKYGAHYDSLDKDSPRIATVLLYLRATDLDGGETAFPASDHWIGDDKARGPFSECAEGHVAAKPKKGDALMFYSLKPDGESDVTSLHTGCPVIAGTKWTATKWIHTKPYHPDWMLAPITDKIHRPEICEDNNQMCTSRAKQGECKKNPEYMVGNTGMGLGQCRRSCDSCEVCKQGDSACQTRNREALGFLPLDQLD